MLWASFWEYLVWVSAGLPAVMICFHYPVSTCPPWDKIIIRFDRAFSAGKFVCGVNEIQSTVIFALINWNHLPTVCSLCFIWYCFYNFLYILSSQCIKQTYNGETVCVYVCISVMFLTGYWWNHVSNYKL